MTEEKNKPDGVIYIDTGGSENDLKAFAEEYKTLPPQGKKYAWKYFVQSYELSMYKLRESLEKIDHWIASLERKPGRHKGSGYFTGSDDFIAEVRRRTRDGNRVIEQKDLAREMNMTEKTFQNYQKACGYSSYQELIKNCRK